MKSHILSPVACIDTLTVPVPTWKAWSNWMTHSRTHGATLVLWIGLTESIWLIPDLSSSKAQYMTRVIKGENMGNWWLKDFLSRELVSEAIPYGLLSHTHQLVAKSSPLCFISNFFRRFNTLEAFFCQTKHLWMSRLLCGLRSMVAELKCTKVSDFQICSPIFQPKHSSKYSKCQQKIKFGKVAAWNPVAMFYTPHYSSWSVKYDF